MSEAEAQAIRFTIDHYEPRKARPDLENTYDNLMYCCDECNLRKGDRYPPEIARKDGFRFFRPDQDTYHMHFDRKGIRLEHKSNIGYYSIEALDLNRASLRRIRELRQRLTECDEYVTDGILALKKFHIDQLPPNIRGAASRYINQAAKTAAHIASNIDALLREYTKSPLIDHDDDAVAYRESRTTHLKQLEALYPGSWRAPRAEPHSKQDSGMRKAKKKRKKRR